MLEEDKNVNRMQESLKLFGEIINNEFFWNTKIILLLNKEDLLKEKCLQVDLSHCFPNYDGGLNFDNASKYIQRFSLSFHFYLFILFLLFIVIFLFIYLFHFIYFSIEIN